MGALGAEPCPRGRALCPTPQMRKPRLRKEHSPTPGHKIGQQQRPHPTSGSSDSKLLTERLRMDVGGDVTWGRQSTTPRARPEGKRGVHVCVTVCTRCAHVHVCALLCACLACVRVCAVCGVHVCKAVCMCFMVYGVCTCTRVCITVCMCCLCACVCCVHLCAVCM